MFKGGSGINNVYLLSGFTLAQLRVSMQNFPFAVNTDGLGGYYVNLNKSDRERQIL